MSEQHKYEVIKKLVDENGNKDRASLHLGISRRQVNRLINAYKEKGKAAFVIEATDAGEDGRQKIAAMAKDLEKFSLYDVATMSEALKRENTVYLVVMKSRTSDMVREALTRYRTFLQN